MRKVFSGPGRLAGASLLEVLIAVLVLAVGLLGVAALQAGALRNNQSAYERSEAVIQSYAILDVMRANRDAALAGNYNLAEWTCAPPAGGARADVERQAWIQNIRNSMGSSACVSISCGNNGCTVGVRWDDSRGSGDRQQLQTYSIKTSTRL
ncbi:type IV pilus modification protein PilV [Vulcaniibacterium tengchongense]|uniref:Type IV pilus assembly protein PilV n=1 Tax=Vulcaniibacterium tengchongense TaxID=1273429 RepID=A0A3N4VDL9_9GAMM|nr:type IV pilus modification protein PilV [Vulcaniibacterium tengchongense]RPE81106.1 type IV pilus assembly protein PilV [Vulcaniibacterium tengchongense]